MLKFVVWDKGLVQNDYLGGKSLPINDWFKGTVFTFNDPNNRPLSVDHISSPPTARGPTIRIKLVFVYPPNSTAPEGKDHVRVVVLEVSPQRIFRNGPTQVARTRVVQHSLIPVWDEQLFFHVRQEDLSDSIRLTVFDRNKFTPNSDIGEAEIDIASLVERVRTKDLNTGLHAYSVSTIREFSLPQSPPKKPGRLASEFSNIILIKSFKE
ncbi:hypothetical protein EDB86DRAFT_3108737 [Lactarius hatsudake]|nr:hypothetical protein EDB86DRAFT_3108737 [Lactarius hatsudake]